MITIDILKKINHRLIIYAQTSDFNRKVIMTQEFLNTDQIFK